jgi:peptide/nickel transport system permease protein
MVKEDDPYWHMIWRQFCKQRLGKTALFVVMIFCLVGIYAPLLAASKPLIVQYDGEWYFPLFRYLFYRGYYTKGLDIFFNVLMFSLPAAILAIVLCWHHKKKVTIVLSLILVLHLAVFMFFAYGPSHDPAFDATLNNQRHRSFRAFLLPNWKKDLHDMTAYSRLNLVVRYQQRYLQHEHLQKYASFYDAKTLFKGMPTLWQTDRDNEEKEIKRLKDSLKKDSQADESKVYTEASLHYILDKRQWIESQQQLLHYEVMPLIRPFHWEDDAGGDQSLNRHVPFWELTRINRKDLVAALIFGVRISLVVGVLSVGLALAIGLPIGALAGFYGGIFDIIVSRLLEIWEAMPTFFMLLMVVAITQSKSIFLVIATIGIFGWTTFSRYIRGEFFKQRNLPYTEACRALGFNDSTIIFSHIFPNAIPPVLTLLPFAIMGAITSEAGLSFLGLGEDGSCSWGVLMDEGRSAFPSESYLLWPPAILLTLLLVAIAMVGDSFRDALDPKMQR